jgi:SRSO17 transposase
VPLGADSRLIVTPVIGRRETETARQALADFYRRTDGDLAPLITSDEYAPYLRVIMGTYGARKEGLELAEMLAQPTADGVPFRWVGGDSVCGDNPALVQGVRALGKWYVLDIACDTQVWAEPPRVIPADQRPRPRRGRLPSKPLVVGERRRVDEIAAALPATAWRRVMVGEGSQGPRVYEYAEVAAWFCEDDLPGPPERLLVRRSLGQSAELKYHRAGAPAAPLEKLAQVRGTRWTIEEDIQSGRGNAGWTNTRRAAGRVGTTTPPCRCWR